MTELIDNNDITRDSIHYENPLPTDSLDFQSSNRSRDHDSNILSMSQGNTRLTISVYGNDLRMKNPYRMGNVITFIFFNGHPLVVLGPQCKQY